MELSYLYWPHSVLGPKIFTKKELKDYLLTYLVFDQWCTKDDVLKLFKKRLSDLKTKLNNLYSYLKRLDIPDEQEKIYNSYLKKIKAGTNNIKQVKTILETNITILEELAKQLPKNYYMNYKHGFLHRNLNYISDPIKNVKIELDKNTWIKAKKAITHAEIKSVKDEIDQIKKDYSEKLAEYNDLNQKIML